MTCKMQMKWMRTWVLLLILCMIIPLLVACNEGENPNKDNPSINNKPNIPNTPTDVPDVYNVDDTLPESENYNMTFTISYFLEQYLNDFWVDARTGGVIDNAVFDAISRTEERFGVDIVAIHSGTGTEGEHVTWIKNQIGAGKTDFDVARTHDVHGANLSLEGVLVDLNDVPNLNFDKPWWPQNTMESLSFMGQMYLMSSSISYRGLSSTSALFFNKGLMSDHGYELPYELVQSGDWYLEDMFISVEDFYLEGDMGIDGKSSDDTFGIVIPSQLYCWPESFGIEVVQKDPETGELILNGHDERMYNMVELMYNVVWENDGGYVITRPDAQAMFGENRALYIPVHLGSAVDVFLNYKVDYGIVPYPKLDETQEQYYAGYTDRYFVIPNTCSDTAYVGTILESMSAEGYRQVTPAYFEVALKNRYTKDQISKEMVDLIKQSMILDFAYVYGGNTWWTDTLRDLIASTTPSKDYASYYQKKLSAAETRVTRVTEAFEEMLENKEK
jgi:ABC-type glycerol-3-phosphate transport system substrate-binding protein